MGKWVNNVERAERLYQTASDEWEKEYFWEGLVKAKANLEIAKANRQIYLNNMQKAKERKEMKEKGKE